MLHWKTFLPTENWETFLAFWKMSRSGHWSRLIQRSVPRTSMHYHSLCSPLEIFRAPELFFVKVVLILIAHPNVGRKRSLYFEEGFGGIKCSCSPIVSQIRSSCPLKTITWIPELNRVSTEMDFFITFFCCLHWPTTKTEPARWNLWLRINQCKTISISVMKFSW